MQNCCHPAALTILVCYLLLFTMSVSGDAGKAQGAANPGRRMYTVLPPPANYKTDSEKSVTLPQLESINSAEDPAGKTTIILNFCNCDVRNEARRNLRHEVSVGWRPIIKVTLRDCLPQH